MFLIDIVVIFFSPVLLELREESVRIILLWTAILSLVVIMKIADGDVE